MQNFDVIVVGGGPAGYNSAEYAAHHGKKVLLVDADQQGFQLTTSHRGRPAPLSFLGLY